MCKCDKDNGLPNFLCMKCGSQSTSDKTLASRWETAFGDIQALDPEPETEELIDWLDGGEHEPVTYISAAKGLLMTLWQDGNVIACWTTITGRKQSLWYGWTMTVEEARDLSVAT